jgi:hypothetical protein
MNDPVTNVEIEDVLSSIRRLVSEDARVRPSGWQVESAETAAASNPAADAGRLVLTPALRVTEAEQAEEAQAEEAQAEADDAILAEEAVETHPEEAQPDEAHRDDALRDEDYRDEVAFAHHADDGDRQHDHDSADAQDMSGDAAETVAAAEDHDRAESVEDAQDDEGQGWATAEAAPLVLSDAAEEAMVWEDHHDEAAPDTAQHAYVAEVETDAFSEAEDVTLHPVSHEPDPDHEPDAAGFVFASTRDGSGHDRAAAAAAPEQADESDPLDDRAFLLSEDEAILDEETLREMVAEIVRQELQGALGERITRNVRKLVRREIHRAMTSHEME